MDEQGFIERRRPEWERLAAILERASKGGLRSLSGAELLDLGKLYRRVTSDLSYANANFAADDLIVYLNELAGKAHGHLYADAPTGGARSVVSFLLRGFPILFRAKWKFIAVAAALFLLGSVFAGVVVTISPESSCDFIPSGFGGENAEKGSKPTRHDLALMIPPAQMSSQIMTNNIRVSFAAFAGGVTFGIFTVWALIQNGVMLGALAVVNSHSWPQALEFWSLILPHGIIELTAIFIAGGSGLILAWSLIAPGNFSRWDALRNASREAVPLVGGVVAMLVVAGCIEGFFTPAPIPPELKLGFAVMTLIGMLTYFSRAGRTLCAEKCVLHHIRIAP